ncbi:MAG: alpha-amylase family glycosyl hydrolase [Pseudomonadota bacterium]
MTRESATRIFSGMRPETFNIYADQYERKMREKIPWRWVKDANKDGYIDQSEVRYTKASPHKSDTDIAWFHQGASVITAAQPMTVFHIFSTDRFKNGDAANDIPANACEDQIPSYLCDEIIRKTTDPSNPRLFQGGDFKGIGQEAEWLSRMSEAIYLGPIQDNLRGTAEGGASAYHNYWMSHLTRIQPRYGTEQDFKNLVTSLNGHGVGVQLDSNLHHAGPRRTNGYSPDMGKLYIGDGKYWDYWKEHEALGLKSNEYDAVADDPKRFWLHTPEINNWTQPNPDPDTPAGQKIIEMLRTYSLADLAQFNTKNLLVADVLQKSALYFLRLVDGFRFDVIKHMDPKFILPLVEKAVASKKRYLLITGEWFNAGEYKDDGEPSDPNGTVFRVYNTPYMHFFDFGFQQAVHDVWGNGKPLGRMHQYLKHYASLSAHQRIQFAPFIDNHDKPMLFNKDTWPTSLTFLTADKFQLGFQGPRYKYGQDAFALYDYEGHLESHNTFPFGPGGDPFNRRMIFPGVPKPEPSAPDGRKSYIPERPSTDISDEKLLENQYQRQFALDKNLARQHAQLLMFGSFETGLKEADPGIFGDKNTVCFKRAYFADDPRIGEEFLFLHVQRAAEDALFDPDKKIKDIRVNFPAGRYQDPFTHINYDIAEDGHIRPVEGLYEDPILHWKVEIRKDGNQQLAGQTWRNNATEVVHNIYMGMSDIPRRSRLCQSCDESPMIQNPKNPKRFRVTYDTGIQEQVDIEGGKIRLWPDSRTIVLIKSPEKKTIVPYMGVDVKD